MITCAEERGVEESDDILDGAGFGDGGENIAGLDAFDDFVFDAVFYARAYACANARANACARARANARTRSTIRTRTCATNCATIRGDG